MKYRKEIDGLRTVAVVPVVLFHAGWSGWSGGFIGVDIFFVISGYLITTLIIEELDQGSFSIARFYERRARRILPALLFVCAISLILGWLIMVPPGFDGLSRTMLFALMSGSNIYFWRTSGYFSESAETNPLLHTWSLCCNYPEMSSRPQSRKVIMVRPRERSRAGRRPQISKPWPAARAAFIRRSARVFQPSFLRPVGV